MTVNPAGHVRIRDWMAALPPQPLPRAVAPLPYEAIHHYLRRLANANHLTVTQLSNLIHSPSPPGPGGGHFTDRKRMRLAAAAGQPVDRITRLYWGPGPDDRDAVGQRQAYGHGLRPACRRCAARHGLLDPVPARLPDHYMICRRHRLWIGPGVRTPAGQLDLANIPELVRSQRRHEQLLRDHTPAVVAGTHHRAIQIWHSRLVRRLTLTPLQQRRVDTLTRNGAESPLMVDTRRVRHDRVNSLPVQITLYPEVVQLTELLLDLRGESRWAWIWNRRR